MNESGQGLDYIVSIVDKILHVVPTGAVASELDKFTTGSSRCGTTIREARVRLFRVDKGRT